MFWWSLVTIKREFYHGTKGTVSKEDIEPLVPFCWSVLWYFFGCLFHLACLQPRWGVYRGGIPIASSVGILSRNCTIVQLDLHKGLALPSTWCGITLSVVSYTSLLYLSVVTIKWSTMLVVFMCVHCVRFNSFIIINFFCCRNNFCHGLYTHLCCIDHVKCFYFSYIFNWKIDLLLFGVRIILFLWIENFYVLDCFFCACVKESEVGGGLKFEGWSGRRARRREVCVFIYVSC